jgi:hypothetical protein
MIPDAKYSLSGFSRPEGKVMQSSQWFAGAVLGIFLLAAGSVPAQNNSQNTQDHAATPNSDSTKPGAPQASLAKLAGDYDRIIKFVGPAGAGIAPSSGTAKISIVLGGRFIMEESTDMVMGRKVDGLRLYGYNNITKHYEMARTYTMSTAITMMTGTSSDGGKTIEFDGGSDSSAGKMPLHAHLRILSDNEFEVTMSTIGDDGKDAPFQETMYSRKK